MIELLSEPPVQVHDEELVELENMTKSELLQYAESIGMNGLDSSMKKADIIKAIEDAE